MLYFNIANPAVRENNEMAYSERQDIIKNLEGLRGSRVITLITGDRVVAPTMIADDCLRPLYDHLLSVTKDRKPEKIDLVLYTRGGFVETPWKIVTKIRQFCQQFNVIIPYRAHSAGTMIAMGADTILMSPMSELGPIDPFVQMRPEPGKAIPFLLPDLGVEDVAAYISFLKERVGITDQDALANNVKSLAEHMTPTLLGRMERIYSHIRVVARKLLALCKPPLAEATITTIIEALTEKMYAHGHGISIDEAQLVGLMVKPMPTDVGKTVWDLYLDYENALALNANPDPYSYFPDDAANVYQETGALGVLMESAGLAHVFSGTIRIERVRKMPPQLNINLNFPLNLPPSVQPQTLPQQVQAIIQQLLQQAAQQLQGMVQAEIARQAPTEAVVVRWVGGAWRQALP
jgi:hypothetical protein